MQELAYEYDHHTLFDRSASLNVETSLLLLLLRINTIITITATITITPPTTDAIIVKF